MTSLAVPVVPGPFDGHFGQRQYAFQDDFSRYPHTRSNIPLALGRTSRQSSRQFSPFSDASTHSAPVARNDENCALPIQIPAQKRTGNEAGAAENQNCSSSLPSSSTRYLRSISNQKIHQIPSKPRKASRANGPFLSGWDNHVAPQDATRAFNLARPPTKSGGGLRQLKNVFNEYSAAKGRPPQDNGMLEGDERKYKVCKSDLLPLGCSRDETCRDQSAMEIPPLHSHRSVPNPSSSVPDVTHHCKQLSDASSGLVHTIKTASVSIASASLFPKSLRFGTSSESQGYPSSQSYPRFSMDSERPPTTSSVDDDALRRGIKRHQVLQEIIDSEEGYITDLRALVYLYSTLFASTNSLSPRMKQSVYRNVVDLLHTHEDLVKQLHSAALTSASRRWAESASPRKLAHRHLRWRSMGVSSLTYASRKHRRTRSSFESSEMVPLRARLRNAEPADVTDIARVFRKFVPLFVAYEEYCSKYGIIVQELHRNTPRWAAFETGIEALAKSVVALNAKEGDQRKAMTVQDLLMKPIQRMCKYPLLFSELLKNVPVIDCPVAHAEVESVLMGLRDIVSEINTATDNPSARRQIQRRWLLHERLTFDDDILKASEFRNLGAVELCGVLHVTYQNKHRIDGCYAMCLLLGSYFVLAMPAGATSKFLIGAVIHLSDLQLDSASDGRGRMSSLFILRGLRGMKGLQCHSALFTWKLSFEANGQLYELVLSACSPAEEDQWKLGLQQKVSPSSDRGFTCPATSINPELNLKPNGAVFCQASTLTRRLSIQRAATVGNRNSVCQVLIRNTHNPQDLQDFRNPSHVAINRSQSHLSSHRLVVLAPKRSERSRLEASLADVWTREKLPYPGMIASRSGQIIRASAGSLVRKLSLASMHGHFGRRSSSLTLSQQKPYEALFAARSERQDSHVTPAFEIQRKDSHEELYEKSKALEDSTLALPQVPNSPEIHEPPKGAPVDEGAGPSRRNTKAGPRRVTNVTADLGPNSPAHEFYASQTGDGEGDGERLSSRKRWSHPFGLLKNLSADGFRHLLYSSK